MNTWFVMVCFVLCIIGVALLHYTRRGGMESIAALEEAGMAVDVRFPAWDPRGVARALFVQQVLNHSRDRSISVSAALNELLCETERIPPKSLEFLLNTLFDLGFASPRDGVLCLQVCKEIHFRAVSRRFQAQPCIRVETELVQTIGVLRAVARPLKENSLTKARFKDLQALLNALRSQGSGSLNGESLRTDWLRNLLQAPSRSPLARARAN